MPRWPLVLAGCLIAGAAAGCTIPSGGGTPVSLPTVVPQATTTYSATEAVVDAYVAPARAGGAVVFHATVSDTTLSALELVAVSARTGSAVLHLTLPSGGETGLGAGAVLGITPTALRAGQTLAVTLDFNRGGDLHLTAPVGGTAAR